MMFNAFSLAVLKCLQARYRLKVFYTHAGCTLVALNPFQPIPDLYSLDVMKEYHCAPQPQVFMKSQLSVTLIQLPYISIGLLIMLKDGWWRKQGRFLDTQD